MIILREAQKKTYQNVVRSSDNSKQGAVQNYKTLFVAVIILKGTQIQVYKTLFVAVITIREAQYKFIKRCS